MSFKGQVCSYPRSLDWVKRWCITDVFDIFACWSFKDYKKALVKFRKLSAGRYHLRCLWVLE